MTGWLDVPRCRPESPGDGILKRLPERAHPERVAGEAADLTDGPPDRLTEQRGFERAMAR